MNIKRILGLDLGTNSIGWALVEINDIDRVVTIIALGSRVIPMSEQEISEFDKGGKIISAASNRTKEKSVRKNHYRFAIRRDRLHCVLNLLDMLPQDYAINIVFEDENGHRCGHFNKYKEPKLAYDKDHRFIFRRSYEKMCEEFFTLHPELRREKNGEVSGIPQDWTLFYLRKKALTEKIELDELSWVILSFIQRRGYEPVSGTEADVNDDKIEGKITEDIICFVSDANKYTLLNDKRKDLSTFILVNENGTKELEAICDSNLLNVGEKVYLRKISTTDEEGNVTQKQYEVSYIFTDEENDIDYEVNFQLGDNNIQRGRVSRKKCDDKTNWKIIKVRNESEIDAFNKEHNTVGVGSYVYHTLLNNPNKKIHGGLYQTIDRDYYREELQAILNKQAEYHTILSDMDKVLLGKAADLLYPHNEQHNRFLKGKDLIYLLCEDVVFYQRDLKPKKSTIRSCPFEYEHYEEAKHLKVAHKANPLYQEFSLRDRLNNLRLTKNEVEVDGKLRFNEDVTDLLLTPEVKKNLYTQLCNREHVTKARLFAIISSMSDQKVLLSEEDYSWNYDDNFKFPCSPYRNELYKRIKRVKKIDANAFLDFEQHVSCNCVQTTEYQLWQLFYSVRNRKKLEAGLRKLLAKQTKKYCLANKLDIDAVSLSEDLYENLRQFEGYKNEYGKFSERMIKKILPYMKEGYDLSSACKEVYGYYNAGEIEKSVFMSPNDIRIYIQNAFPKMHLNNPVVEKVVREALFTVADIWDKYAERDSDGKVLPLFDTIKIELGRELKKSPKQKKKIAADMLKNSEANQRVVALLKELKKEFNNIDIHSASALRKMHIYEEGAFASLGSAENDQYLIDLNDGGEPLSKEEIEAIRKQDFSRIVTARAKKENYVTKSEIRRYRLWLEQRYRSPYTGKIIPLTRLFDEKTKEAYEVDHIFPRKRVTLNAMTNLVLCEAEVNRDKGDKTGMEYIKDKEKGNGEVIIDGKPVKILSPSEYCNYVKAYIKDRNKQKILLSEEIPSDFTNSQGNNSQHIARRVKDILSAIVRPDTTEGKYADVISTNGAITSILKRDWHLNDVWNRLMMPRFERLNKWVSGTPFTREANGHLIPCVPEPYCYDFEIKRIDHRHHALDALIIALTGKEHINYINTESAGQERFDLKAKWMQKENYTFLPPGQFYEQRKVIKYKYKYSADHKLYADFQQAAYNALSDVVVTFKQKRTDHLRRQRINWFKRPNEEGMIVLEKEKGLRNKNKYAVRIQMHDATLRGLRHERLVTAKDAISNNKEFVQKKVRAFVEQKKNEGLSSQKLIECVEKQYPYILVREEVLTTRWKNSIYRLDPSRKDSIPIESIADIRIYKILDDYIKTYLEEVEGDGEEEYKAAMQKALSEEGIKRLNTIIEQKYHHKPIYVLPTVVARGSAKPLSTDKMSVKNKQFAKTADNPYKTLIISELHGERVFDVIDQDILVPVSDSQKDPDKRTLFTLTAGDLVYVPTEDEQMAKSIRVQDLDRDRIYKFMYPVLRKNKPNAYFIPHRMANQIFDDDKCDKYVLVKKSPKARKDVLQGELKITTRDNRTETMLSVIEDGKCVLPPTIRDICWKLVVDRLGNITDIIRKPHD